MDKSNLELFREALLEAMSSKANEADLTEKIEPSDRHKVAMQAILDGAYLRKSAWHLKMLRIAAIIAAALLLAGCAYRNEIRDFIEEICDEYIEITYSDKVVNGRIMEEAYKLTYVPEGYVLKEIKEDPIHIRYEYRNGNNSYIRFIQGVIDGYSHAFDNDVNTEIITIENVRVYHFGSAQCHYYMWNDGKYAYDLSADVPLSIEELSLIINGVAER